VTEREREREKEAQEKIFFSWRKEAKQQIACRSHEVQQRLVLCFSLSAGNSAAHRRKCKAYYSLSLSVHFSVKKILLKIEGSADDILAISVWNLLQNFAFVCRFRWATQEWRDCEALSLSLSQRQASRQLQQRDDVDPGEGRIDR
jgi:hypothetical protein